MNDKHLVSYQPKGSMCKVCKFINDDCSRFEFDKMPVTEKYRGINIVICSEFVRIVK